MKENNLGKIVKLVLSLDFFHYEEEINNFRNQRDVFQANNIPNDINRLNL